ncbi:caspase family protein [Cyanobium sp. FGCU-6]|nr:caspase family protein [Cyanobium sp. FGCU6]
MAALLAAAPLAWPTALAPPAWAQEPAASAKPFPAIEAGMHTAQINRIAVDRAGRWAVTASDDKTARIWNLASGKQEGVLRVTLGEGDEGKLYAVALSPDGALVALGGFTGPSGEPKTIYLFDRASGRLLQRLAGLPNVVNHLAFAADGRRLAAALGGANGIRVYGATGQGAWAQVAADGDYGAASYSVEFDAAGRLLATSFDGELRLYGAGGSGRLQSLVRRAAPGGKRPFFARFSPDGRRIAVGFYDSPAVAVLDGTSLEPLAPADTSSITNGNISSVDWSADGRRLLAAGRYIQDDGSVPLVVWPAGGGAPQRLPLGMTDVVMDLRPLADGRLVFAGGDPAWGVLDPQLRPTKVFAGPPVLDHRSDVMRDRPRTDGFQSFRQAPDGRWLEFRAVGRAAQGPTARLVRFDLAQRRLLLPGAAAPGGLAPRSTGLPIEGWQNTTSPTLAGKPLPLNQYEMSRSLAISADGSAFSLGADWAVRVFSADGRERWRTPTLDAAWLVNLSADGRFVVAALGDGTIRWYRTRAEGSAPAGSEALALFVHPDLKRWILWTPEGFYDASEGGAELFGYHLNNGRNQPGTFISSAQLQQKFFRPDLIARRLAGEEAAIAAAVAEVGDVRTSLSTASLPPLVKLDGGEGEAVRYLANGDVEVRFELIDRGGGIGELELRLNRARIEGRQNLRGGNRQAVIFTPPPGQLNKVRIAARSLNQVLGDAIELQLRPIAAPATPARLHVLAVGITRYDDLGLRQGVRFAADDARALVDTLERRVRPASARLGMVVLIPEGEATRQRILAALAAMVNQVKAGDRLVLHLAGHGTAIDGEYYFLTRDTRASSLADVKATALSGSDLGRALSSIGASGGSLLLFDTCSSGTYGSQAQSDLQASLDRFQRQDGRLMLAAAGDRRMALESPDDRRGIFTGVVIEGLLGGADFIKDRVIQSNELTLFVQNQVPQLTVRQFNQAQRPVANFVGTDFPLTEAASPAP